MGHGETTGAALARNRQRSWRHVVARRLLADARYWRDAAHDELRLATEGSRFGALEPVAARLAWGALNRGLRWLARAKGYALAARRARVRARRMDYAVGWERERALGACS